MNSTEQLEAPEQLSHPASGRRGRLALVALGSVLMAALAVLLIARLGGSGGQRTLHGPAGNAFTLRYPPSWRTLSSAKLRRLPTHPLVVLVRKDRKGVVTIRRDKSGGGLNGQKLAEKLDADFRRRLPDYRRVTADILRTKAGRVFFFSYVRQKQGTLHTISVIPAGDHRYVLDTVSDPAAGDVAAQIVAMIRSFSPA